MSNELTSFVRSGDTLERVLRPAPVFFDDPHGVPVFAPDVWRALQSRFLPGSESRHAGIDLARGPDRSAMAGAIFDGVAPYDVEELRRIRRNHRPRAAHDDYPCSQSPYSAQVFQHPKAFDFNGVVTQTRSHGSIASDIDGQYRPRIKLFEAELLERPGQTWPRAVDWVDPEVRDMPEVEPTLIHGFASGYESIP